MEATYDNNGNPLVMIGKIAKKESSQVQPHESSSDTFTYNGIEYVSWGDNNKQPEEDEKAIRKSTVLTTGLVYKCEVVHGEGCVPVTIAGYDENCNTIYKPVENNDIVHYLNSKMFENYLSVTIQNLYKYGNAFPILVFNYDASKILRVDPISSRHCRISSDKKKLLIYGDFENGNPTNDSKKPVVVLDMLDEIDPLYDLENRRLQGKLTGKQIAFPRIKNFFCSNDYYGTPDWYSARNAGWLDIALKASKFISAAYENSMFTKLHLKIPYTFWEKKFPMAEYPDKSTRQALISEFQNNLEKTLCGEENANKALISHFTPDSEMECRDEWKVEPIDNKKVFDEKLATSAAANSEILFSLQVNPSVLGAGMPGGPYSGNAGSGSDIREGFSISTLLSHIEREQVLDPVELMLRFNGIKDIHIKFRNTLLTTLDKGKTSESKLM